MCISLCVHTYVHNISYIYTYTCFTYTYISYTHSAASASPGCSRSLWITKRSRKPGLTMTCRQMKGIAVVGLGLS